MMATMRNAWWSPWEEDYVRSEFNHHDDELFLDVHKIDEIM